MATRDTKIARKTLLSYGFLKGLFASFKDEHFACLPALLFLLQFCLVYLHQPQVI